MTLGNLNTNGTPDFKFAFSVTGGSIGRNQFTEFGTVTASPITTPINVTLTANVIKWFEYTGVLVVTSTTTLALQWAQRVSHSSTTSLLDGSLVIFEKVA